MKITTSHLSLWQGRGSIPNSYVFGFTPSGKKIASTLLNGVNSGRKNLSDGIYAYDTSTDDGTTGPGPSLKQKETINQNSDFYIPFDYVDKIIHQGRSLTDNITLIRQGTLNVVSCLVSGTDIPRPEKVSALLYVEQLKGLSNKRYIIINRWEHIDPAIYAAILSVILRVRAMENNCVVILSSNNLTKCYQCG